MNIGVLCGGVSSEHEVSILTGLSIYNKFDFVNLFYYIDKFGVLRKIRHPKVGYLKGSKVNFNFKKIGNKKIDFIILALHGKNGEDGVIPALLDYYQIPYLGSRFEASILSFDKELNYKYLKDIVPFIPKKVIKSFEDLNNLDYPLIFKPARSGSSLGIGVAYHIEDAKKCYSEALKYDSKVLAEAYLENIKEYSIALYKDFDIVFSKVEEIRPKGEIFSFENKYYYHTKLNDHKFISDEALSNEIKELSKKVYEALDLKDIVRMDFILSDGKLYFNEVNQIPGGLAMYFFDDFDIILKNLIELNKNQDKVYFPSIDIFKMEGKK